MWKNTFPSCSQLIALLIVLIIVKILAAIGVKYFMDRE